MSPRLRIVIGKGGVGKTAVAAALGLAEAQRGRTVLISEVRAASRVSNLLQVAPVGARMREVLERVWVVDMNPDDAIHEYVLMTLRFERVYKAVFENRLVRGLVHLVPSLAELVMLGKLWYHEREAVRGRLRFDTLILDAPATGHGLALLRTPFAVEATVPAGPLKDHARDVRELLTDHAKTRLHIVTTPEEMPVNEANDIERAMRLELGIRLGHTILNQRLAPLPEDALGRLEKLRGDPELGPSVRALAIREGKRREGEAQIARLNPVLREETVSLPRLVEPTFGLAQVRELASLLTPVLEA